ncbi:zn-finger domain-containing protein [Gigaspora margarita]|uniref:Zn-finger domain-containing protein n=1 Tax=Gigaspora margarita TaxID=4874 RepID=A0A8H3XJ33_GIGMA|nr:zn-finger domain-containing protein [Gigaspora margarita]
MPLMSCIQNILEISDISQTFVLEYEELYKTTKWKTTQSTLPTGAKILFIILYSDATNCDLLSKNQLHPIYLSLGNLSTWHRNRQDAKQLLGYLPIIKSNVGKEIKRQLFYKYLDIILEAIQTFLEKETNLLLNNKFIWFYPKILTIITDWPEAATFCLTYKSTKSKHPCHFCLVKRDNLTNTNFNKKDMEFRNHENMQYYYNSNEEQTVSIEMVPNIFWKFK